MPKIVNRAYMTTATTGTGLLTLGAAVASFRSFAASGVVDGDVVRYVIEDGENWEIGSGTYAATGTTLTRAVEDSSNGGAAITLSGTAVAFVTAAAADFGGGDFLGTVTADNLDLSTGTFFEVTAAEQTLTFSNPPAVHGFSIKVTGGGSISGFELGSASYNEASFNVTSQDSAPSAVAFKPDGTKMYVAGGAGDSVYEYNLSVAWDVSTASSLQSFSITGQETNPNGLAFKPDGTKMYVVGSTNDTVYEYNLSVAWDVSGASLLQSFSVGSQEATPLGLTFKPDGTKMYVVGNNGDEVNEYNLSIAWDVSTASFLQKFSVLAQDGNAQGIFFAPDGTKMYISGFTGVSVYEYNLGAAWDVSTAVFFQAFSTSAQDNGITDLFFKPDGTKMYIVGAYTDSIYEYNTAASIAAGITYPASVTFESGSTPAPPAIGAVNTISLYTVNGGTNYYDKG